MATILCIDPNPETLAIHKAALESSGYRILAASDESIGISLARNNAFDVAVLDFNMPGMDADPVVVLLIK
jgi:CheY-like chemotaxis protein